MVKSYLLYSKQVIELCLSLKELDVTIVEKLVRGRICNFVDLFNPGQYLWRERLARHYDLISNDEYKKIKLAHDTKINLSRSLSEREKYEKKELEDMIKYVQKINTKLKK